ncbi:MAG: 50S ribosomal protein L25 [Candidatus Omnitrophica bacterium]|nr:50S ribosomal protein L25 [Candidatus Omnitrophota bacterium]
MEQIKLKATVRQDKGKQAVKKLRGQGTVPGTVYHRGEEPVSVALSEREISKIIRGAGAENLLIHLSVENAKKSRTVLIKEVQHHPVTRGILHVDFNEISLTEKITLEVEVRAVGEPAGVKQEGGVLDHPLRELKIQCLPTDIPKHIDVDVSGLKLNQSIHVKDLRLPETLKVLNDPEALLFQVQVHIEEKAEEAAAETPEVEVIREKKEEEGAPAAEKPKEEPKAEKKQT